MAMLLARRGRRIGTWSPAAGLLLGFAILCASCHVTPYQRTLPDWVRRVYVPMAENRTYEPGLEELITNAFVEEILADGRLEVVRRKEADAVVQVVLETYGEASVEFEGDDVESRRDMTLVLRARLFDPNDLDVPFAEVRKFPVKVGYNSDYRAIEVEQVPDARRRLGEEAGRQLLQAIMSRAVMSEKK